jgi:hypothetical protein
MPSAVFTTAVATVFNAWYDDDAGTSSTKFSPADSITRCDALMVLCKVFGVSVDSYQNEESPFTDVPKNDYYSNYVKWAYAKGITSGTTPTTFSPKGAVQRQQLCVFFDKFYTI